MMPETSQTFEQGDIVFLDTAPGERRAALVVSNDAYHRHTGLLIVCPVADGDRQFPLHVPLDERCGGGVVMCEQLQTIDPLARNAARSEGSPPDVLQEVLARVEMCVK